MLLRPIHPARALPTRLPLVSSFHKLTPKSHFLISRRSEPIPILWKPVIPSHSSTIVRYVQTPRITSRRRLEDTKSQSQTESQSQSSSTPKWGVGALAGAGALVLAKWKWILGLLKFGKLLTPLSMLLSSFAYSFFFGWPFAIGMVGLIFVHELGHYFVMKFQGVETGKMVFVPFIGAAVEMRGQPRDAYKEAIIGLGGPVLGTVASIATGFYGSSTGSQLLLALGEFGLMINLFNLLPLGMMDGGRILGALSPWFLVAGLVIGAYLILTGSIRNPFVYLIMLMAAFSTWDRFRNPGNHPAYYNIGNGKKAIISILYLGLLFILVRSMFYIQRDLKSPKQLKQEAGIKDQNVFDRALNEIEGERSNEGQWGVEEEEW